MPNTGKKSETNSWIIMRIMEFDMVWCKQQYLAILLVLVGDGPG